MSDALLDENDNLSLSLYKMLTDADWVHFAKLLDLGDRIMPERAVRFYQSSNQSTEVPLEDKVRLGRRRAIYVRVQDMCRNGLIECRNPASNPDEREYRANPSYDGKKPRWLRPEGATAKVEPRRRERRRGRPPDSLVKAIDSLEKNFSERFNTTVDGDFSFHCRALRRIIACIESEDNQ